MQLAADGIGRCTDGLEAAGGPGGRRLLPLVRRLGSRSTRRGVAAAHGRLRPAVVDRRRLGDRGVHRRARASTRTSTSRSSPATWPRFRAHLGDGVDAVEQRRRDLPPAERQVPRASLHDERQIWIRRDAASPWVVDVPITPDRDGLWTSKRWAEHVVPLEDGDLGRGATGSATSTRRSPCTTRRGWPAPEGRARPRASPCRSCSDRASGTWLRERDCACRPSPGMRGWIGWMRRRAVRLRTRCRESPVYLDHAATTPMVPAAIEAMTAAPARRRQPELAARLRPARPPGRGGVPRDDRAGAELPARRGGVHLRRHRGGQPRAQGHPLGAAGRRPAAHPDPDHRRRAPRRARPAALAGASTRAPRSSCCRSTQPGRLDVDALRAAIERDPDSVVADLGDVGQQRGRHAAADRRGRRDRGRARHPGAHRRRPGRRRGAGRLRRLAASTR